MGSVTEMSSSGGKPTVAKGLLAQAIVKITDKSEFFKTAENHYIPRRSPYHLV